MSFSKKKVKVLPLIKGFWIDDQLGHFVPDMEPVFGREGWYYDRLKKVSWIEFGGRAKKVDTGDFLWRFNHLNALVLRDCEIQALEVLARGRVLSKEMREILYANNLRKEIWETGCETYIYVQRILNQKT